MSKVSIIVPVYNAEPWLDACFAGLRQQGDCEIVLVDDGSTDGSAALCRRFLAEPGVNGVLVQKANGGLSSARNAGIAAASGDYIAFCDADDAYLPGAIAALVEVLEGDAGCGIAVGQFTRSENTAFRPGRHFYVDAAEAVTATLYQEKYFHQSAWAKLYRRGIFDSQPNFAEGRWYEDFEFLPRVYSRTSKIGITTATVYYYRPNPSSFLARWSDGRADALFAADSVCSFVADNMPTAAAAALSRRFSAYFNIYLLARRHSRPDLAARCLAELRQMCPRILADRRCRLKNRLGAMMLRITM